MTAVNRGPANTATPNMQEQQIATGARIYTYATLPAASAYPSGFEAYTSDLGPVYSNGTTWIISSGQIPSTSLTYAQIVSTYAAASYTGIRAYTTDMGLVVSNGTTWQILLLDYITPQLYGAIGDGTHDDGPALQLAINAASSQLAPAPALYIPHGKYKYTTALSINNTNYGKCIKIFGPGSSFGAILSPSGCAALVINGTSAGSTSHEVRIAGVTWDLVAATGTSAISISNAYSVYFEDCFVYNSPTAVTNAIYVTGTLMMVFDNLVLYGQNGSASAVGILFDGAAAVVAKMIDCDVEYTATGVKTTGTVTLDMVAPYIESNATANYAHAISAGMVSIHGGKFYGGSGCTAAIAVTGDNLAVYGLGYTVGDAINFISIAATPTFKNVKIYGAINYGSDGSVIAAGSNMASVEFYPPLPGFINRGVIDFKKTPTSGSPTALIDFSAADLIAVHLTLYGFINASYGSVAQTFDFVIPAATDTGDLTSLIVTGTAAKVNYPVGVGTTWNLALSAPTLTVVSGKWRFGITATLSGSSASAPIALYGKLEYSTYDPSAANVILLL